MFEQALQDITATGALVIVAIGTLIVKLIQIFGKYVEDTWIQIRKNKAYFNEQLRQEREMTKLNEELKKRRTVNIPYLEAVREVQTSLESILQEFSALRVSFMIYHNGTSNGFKNYSVRHQEARTTKDYNIDLYQTRPLSAFYKDFETHSIEAVRVYKPEEKVATKFATSLDSATSVALMHLYIENPSEEDHVILKLKDFGTDKFPIGGLVLVFDSLSNFNPNDETHLNSIKNKRDDIIAIYYKNPQILG